MDSAYYLKISNCPLIAWENRFKNGNEAIRKPNVSYPFTEESDYDAWDILFIDWQENVKQDIDFVNYQANIEQLNKLYLRYLKSIKKRGDITTRDRSVMNEIRRIEGLVLSYERTLGKGISVNKMLQLLSKNQGYHIKKKDLTVQDYFDLIELYSDKPNTDG